VFGVVRSVIYLFILSTWFLSLLKSYSTLWLSLGHYSLSLSKGLKSTTWIWNLYLLAHDFESYLVKPSVTSKVFASNLGYLSVIFLWLGGMHFYRFYFSNYNAWLLSPKTTLISAHIVWFIVN